MIKHFNYSFAPGWSMVPKEKKSEVKLALCNILGSHDETFISRKKHKYRDMPFHIRKEITDVLVSAGVDEDHIWNVEPA